MPTTSLLMALLLAALATPAAASHATAVVHDSEWYPPKDSREASILRGDIAFQSYCALCHGIHADGRGRAARLYSPRPANLRESRRTDAYKLAIIRKGGAALGRSPYMPPWGDELTDEQVDDLVNFLRSIAPG